MSFPTLTSQIPIGYYEGMFYCEDGKILEQVAQGGVDAPNPGSVQIQVE